MHKATLSTNNSGLIILDKNTRNKIFFEILEDYNGICLKNFQRIQKELENAFSAKISIFSRTSHLDFKTLFMEFYSINRCP